MMITNSYLAHVMETELQHREALDYFEFCGKAVHFLVHNDYYEADRPRRVVGQAQNDLFEEGLYGVSALCCQFVNLCNAEFTSAFGV